MLRKSNFELGDYVKYQGNLSTLTEILRKPDIGRIEEFGNNVTGQDRIYLSLLNAQKNIWCDFYDIRPIYTEPEHLRELNFKTIEINGRKKYELDSVIISGAFIPTPKTNYILQYCLADFTNGSINLDNYFENDSLILEKFFEDYPDMSNLNDLFIFLENQGRKINKNQVLYSLKNFPY